MMNWETTLSAINGLFVWDGWRALAAIGTFLAVVVALNRDNRAEQKDRIRQAYSIAALIDLVSSSSTVVKKIRDANNDEEKLKKAYKLAERSGILEKSLETMNSLKMSELPTVETITTVSVLKAEYKHLCDHIGASKPNQPEDISTTITIFDQCLSDLDKEHKFVAGPDYSRVTADGHRAWRTKKLFGGPRKQSIRVIFTGVRMLLSGKAPKIEKAPVKK